MTAPVLPALTNLKAALLGKDDDPFTWYETAQAYSLLKNDPMANPATAELWYNIGDMRKALVFATRAHGKLPQGSADWQRARRHHRRGRSPDRAAAAGIAYGVL